ncbi:hypothetical protein MKX01_004092, partial [Papaver californicum]
WMPPPPSTRSLDKCRNARFRRHKWVRMGASTRIHRTMLFIANWFVLLSHFKLPFGLHRWNMYTL